MPTYQTLPRFLEDYGRLMEEEKTEFWRAIRALVEDLDNGRRIRHDLRPKRVHYRNRKDLWEITWANDGRAIFRYGEAQQPGKAHVIWLQVGSHDILRAPLG
jgi:hypothetical protein